MKSHIFTFVSNYMFTCVQNWKDTKIPRNKLKGHKDFKIH